MKIRENLKARVLTLAVAGLIVGLSGCGSSTNTAGSGPTTSPPTSITSSSPASSTPHTSTPSSAAPSASTSEGAAQNAELTIAIKDFKYAISGPVAPGAMVNVKNADAENHTVTSLQPGAFNVTVDGGGGTAEFKAPAKAGGYVFVCSFHANMKGTLVVK
jgi:plastocyanin